MNYDEVDALFNKAGTGLMGQEQLKQIFRKQIEHGRSLERENQILKERQGTYVSGRRDFIAGKVMQSWARSVWSPKDLVKTVNEIIREVDGEEKK